MVKGARKSNIGYVYGVMDELQRLREDVVALADKNRDLAKQLNVTKMELARERKQQQAILTAQVRSWAKKKAQSTPATSTIGVQCDLRPPHEGEDDEVRELHSFSPGSSMQQTPPRRSSCSPGDPRRSLSPTIKIVRRELLIVATSRRESTRGRDQPVDDDIRMQSPSPPKSTTAHATDDDDEDDDGVARSLAPEFEGRLRRRKSDVSYVEPPLNRKIRRGDYYGLLKRSRLMSPRALSKPPRRNHTTQKKRLQRVPASPPHEITVVRQRLTRPRAAVSYVLPKLNAKLRQGDKFTFTT